LTQNAENTYSVFKQEFTKQLKTGQRNASK